MKVETASDSPVVLLIREGGIPTKTNFDVSNFDDWVHQRNISVIRKKIELGLGAFMGEPATTESPVSGPSCPTITLSLNGRECDSSKFKHCQENCMDCMNCVKSGEESGKCIKQCNLCTGGTCEPVLTACARGVNCSGLEAQNCKQQCASCMACLDSNDAACSGCQCCSSCLPVASKCGFLDVDTKGLQYIFVGIYNHPSDNGGASVGVDVDLSLIVDPDFEDYPNSWLSELWDPFHDIGTLEVASRNIYPAGGQFIYTLTLDETGRSEIDMRLYRSRLTLLHIVIQNTDEDFGVSFESGAGRISRVLTCTRRSPKTMFDFNLDSGATQQLLIHPESSQNIWLLLFGGDDGEISVVVTTGTSSMSYVLVTLLSFVVAIVVFYAFCACVKYVLSRPRMSVNGSYHDSIMGFVQPPRASSAEDVYLNRSGHCNDDI